MQTFTNCAWCGNELSREAESTGDDLTDGICVDCVQDMGVLPHNNISEMDRKFVDDLPYGTIVLDENDHVVRYNQAESKFTGLQIDEVEGRNFFKEIAPCTAVKEFQGVLQKFKQAGTNNQESIKFTFNHRNFQAYVSILISWFSSAGIAVLTIKKVDEEGVEQPILDEQGNEIMTGMESGQKLKGVDVEEEVDQSSQSVLSRIASRIKSWF